MKLASLQAGGRDGSLVVVSRDLRTCQRVPKIAATLQFALEHWDRVAAPLRQVYADLNDGSALAAQPFAETDCHSPLPRAYQWADGSAYLNHVELVRKARGAEMPESFFGDGQHEVHVQVFDVPVDGLLGVLAPVRDVVDSFDVHGCLRY